MIIFGLCAAYGINLLFILVNCKDSNKSFNTEFRDLLTQDNNVFLYQKGFRLGIAFTDSASRPLPLDSMYFTLHVEQGTLAYSGGAVFSQLTNLEYEL